MNKKQIILNIGLNLAMAQQRPQIYAVDYMKK
jgi:hypothetical protein